VRECACVEETERKEESNGSRLPQQRDTPKAPRHRAVDVGDGRSLKPPQLVAPFWLDGSPTPSCIVRIPVILKTEVHIELFLFVGDNDVKSTEDITRTLGRTFCPSARSVANRNVNARQLPSLSFPPQRQSCFSSFLLLLRRPLDRGAGLRNTKRKTIRLLVFVCGMYPTNPDKVSLSSQRWFRVPRDNRPP
jgi:hypothetical protein